MGELSMNSHHHRTHDVALRRQQLVRADAPAGAEVHADGAVHEVQPGEWPIAIAKDYSKLLGIDVTWQAIRDANKGAFDAGFHPGAELRIPGLDDFLEAKVDAAGPLVQVIDGAAIHRVTSGDTLSGIAREYRDTYDVDVSWKDIFDANRDVIGPNPNRIQVGQRLEVPGVAEVAPSRSRKDIDEFGGMDLLTQVTRMRRDDGTLESVDTLQYIADATGARWAGRTVEDALERYQHPGGVPEGEAGTAIVRAKGGMYVVPLFAEWSTTAGMSESDVWMSAGARPNDPNVMAFVSDGPTPGDLEVRRFDQ